MSEMIILTTDTPAIMHLSKKDKRLAKVIQMIGPIKYSSKEDGYTFLVHEIIEQMLSIKAGASIFERLNSLCDNQVAPSTINRLSDDEIKSAGMSSAKVSYIRALTTAINTNQLILSDLPLMSDKEVIKSLTKIKGIGQWTAKMYLIFVLNRLDVLPLEDGAFLQSYRWLYKTDDISAASITKKCKKWKPYSSIAAKYLYRALDTGLTKQEFHLFK